MGRRQILHGDVAEFESGTLDACWYRPVADLSRSEESISVPLAFASCYCERQGQHLCTARLRQWTSACEAYVADHMLDGRAEWVDKAECDGETCSDERARSGAVCTAPTTLAGSRATNSAVAANRRWRSRLCTGSGQGAASGSRPSIRYRGEIVRVTDFAARWYKARVAYAAANSHERRHNYGPSSSAQAAEATSTDLREWSRGIVQPDGGLQARLAN